MDWSAFFLALQSDFKFRASFILLESQLYYTFAMHLKSVSHRYGAVHRTLRCFILDLLGKVVNYLLHPDLPISLGSHCRFH